VRTPENLYWTTTPNVSREQMFPPVPANQAKIFAKAWR
jgi:hypothetical protein